MYADPYNQNSRKGMFLRVQNPVTTTIYTTGFFSTKRILSSVEQTSGPYPTAPHCDVILLPSPKEQTHSVFDLCDKEIGHILG